VSDISGFSHIVTLNPKEKVEANQSVADRITRALFFFFSSGEQEMDEKDVEELLDEVFNIASVAMAVLRIDIVGKNENNEYVARFSPYASFDEFAKQNQSS
jgi:hypothetical protein